MRCATNTLLLAVLTGSSFAQAFEIVDIAPTSVAGFDPVRGRIVRVASDGATWEWDGTNWFRKVAVLPPPGSPTGMEIPVTDLVFDPVTREMLVFTNAYQSPGYNLYAYDGVRWRRLTLPPMYKPVVLAYDVARSRRVIVIQITFTTVETWEDSGSGWVLVSTATGPPPLTWPYASAFDPVTSRVWVCGRSSGSVWSYDGVSWQPQLSGPTNVASPALTHDAARQVVVLTSLNDVWEFNGSSWTQTTPGVPVGPCSLMFDNSRQRVLALRDADLARWDGSSLTIVDRLPRPDVQRRLVYDPIRDATVVVTAGGTWQWQSGRWSQSSATQPPIEAAFFDLLLGSVVGVSLSAVPGIWSWNGTNWLPQPAPPNRPPARTGYSLAFDWLRGSATMFGGTIGGVDIAETWEWNTVTWQRRSLALEPPPRHDAGMVFDVARSRTIMLGGSNGTQTLADAWEWDGTAWTQQAPLSWLGSSSVDMGYDTIANHPIAVTHHFNNFGPLGSSITAEVHTLTASGWQEQLVRQISPSPLVPRVAATFDSRRGGILVWINGSMVWLPVHGASASISGTGCGRPLRLSARAWPRAGELNSGFDVDGVLGAALVAVSSGTSSVPIGGSCVALLPSIDASFLVVAPTPGGFGEVQVPIPDDPLFRGLAVHAQAVQLDPSTPIGLGLSARLDLVIGD